MEEIFDIAIKCIRNLIEGGECRAGWPIELVG